MVRRCSQCSLDSAGCLKFNWRAFGRIYGERHNKSDETWRKLEKVYPEAKWHKPLNANGITEEGIRNWM